MEKIGYFSSMAERHIGHLPSSFQRLPNIFSKAGYFVIVENFWGDDLYIIFIDEKCPTYVYLLLQSSLQMHAAMTQFGEGTPRPLPFSILLPPFQFPLFYVDFAFSVI